MADKSLRKLSRAELLEMMIAYSEEAEAARQHETEYREELEKEKPPLRRLSKVAGSGRIELPSSDRQSEVLTDER